MKVEGFLDVGQGEKFRFKGIVSSFTRRHAMKGNGIEAKTPPKGKNLNNSKARVSNLKEILSKRGLLSKGANPRGMLVGNPKERVSIIMKWAITECSELDSKAQNSLH